MIPKSYFNQVLKKKKIIIIFLGVFLTILDLYFLARNPIYVVYLFFILLLFYLFGCSLSCIAHKRKSKFRCLICGECCKLKVNVTDKEIKIIESRGFKRNNFIKGGRVLKRVNGYCVFLKYKRGKRVCSIYKFRPSVCRKWPFFLYPFTIPWHWFFRCPALRKLVLK